MAIKFADGISTRRLSERAQAAAEILDVVAKKSERLKSIVTDTSSLHAAYLELAMLPVEDVKTLKRKIPSGAKLVQLRDLKHALIPTVTLPIDPSLKYDKIYSFKSV